MDGEGESKREGGIDVWMDGEEEREREGWSEMGRGRAREERISKEKEREIFVDP